MESATSVASHQTKTICCYYYPIPIPKYHLHLPPHLPKFISSQPLNLHFKSRKHHNFISPCAAITTTCSKDHQENHNYDDPCHQNPIFSKKPQKNDDPESNVISTNSWWEKLRAVVGQSVNLEGISGAFGIIAKDRHLVVPHIAVPDIRYIDWVELKRKGFQGVVFDKDNTLTVPYSFTIWRPLRISVEECKSVFGTNIAVFSNSAGLQEYDRDGRIARALEFKIGIKVIRHQIKKPAGSAEEIEQHFGCDSSRLIMVGDRPFTDIAYGNRNGFLTILTNPLSLDEEPLIVNQVRKLEVSLVKRWSKKGFHPTSHWLLPDSSECVIDHSPL
ncbi:hypothetical protein DCAR_0311065 [Daucus carota subsp. sativus]|uniref:Uncharacterized protein n=1 Tax=Daucus carota subsp. sativus TaxID=79200 RepID=A0AAF0WNF9_DAUCS|nr:PREDICTED: uncharacterized protein LOC108211355 [Daucus carota subsp. sativus]WOG91811.1 hypothetical protein DCAR_0311065 [Daucus carota subsp. sativus]